MAFSTPMTLGRRPERTPDYERSGRARPPPRALKLRTFGSVVKLTPQDEITSGVRAAATQRNDVVEFQKLACAAVHATTFASEPNLPHDLPGDCLSIETHFARGLAA